MTGALSKPEIVAWCSRLVLKTGGAPDDFQRHRGREISPLAVARMAGISYRLLKYIARGRRGMSARTQTSLSSVIRRIESGRVAFTRQSGSAKREAVPVEQPHPRLQLSISLEGGPKLIVRPALEAPKKLPSFRGVFESKR